MAETRTLEESVVALIGVIDTLKKSVEASVASMKKDYETIRAAIGYDFFVSKTGPVTEKSDTSLAAIQIKIELKRQQNPAQKVSVFVESFTDNLPVSLSSNDVIWRFLDSLELGPPAGTRVFDATGERLTIQGLRVTFAAESDDNIVIENKSSERLYIRQTVTRNGGSQPFRGDVESIYNPGSNL